MAHAHPLEGDGIRVSLFHYLWKKGQGLDECQLKFKIPDTVVMFNQPTIWYYWSETQNEIRKRSGKELERSNIIAKFCKRRDASSCDIVASFLSHRLDEEDTIDFLDEARLTDFLMNSQNQQGLLQKFLLPKGDHNEMIQAVWSPRMCLVNKRVNRLFLNDRVKDPNDKCITYEGPTHFTEEALTAAAVKKKVREVCESVVEHFRTVEHYYTISRMVMYFKEERFTTGNCLWLIFSSSLRVDEAKYERRKAPLSLTPQFKGLYNDLREAEDQPPVRPKKTPSDTEGRPKSVKRYRTGFLKNIRIEDMQDLAKAALSAGMAEEDEGVSLGLRPISDFPLPTALIAELNKDSKKKKKKKTKKQQQKKGLEEGPQDSSSEDEDEDSEEEGSSSGPSTSTPQLTISTTQPNGDITTTLSQQPSSTTASMTITPQPGQSPQPTPDGGGAVVAPNDNIKSEMLLERIYFNKKSKQLRQEVTKWSGANVNMKDHLQKLIRDNDLLERKLWDLSRGVKPRKLPALTGAALLPIPASPVKMSPASLPLTVQTARSKYGGPSNEPTPRASSPPSAATTPQPAAAGVAPSRFESDEAGGGAATGEAGSKTLGDPWATTPKAGSGASQPVSPTSVRSADVMPLVPPPSRDARTPMPAPETPVSSGVVKHSLVKPSKTAASKLSRINSDFNLSRGKSGNNLMGISGYSTNPLGTSSVLGMSGTVGFGTTLTMGGVGVAPPGSPGARSKSGDKGDANERAARAQKRRLDNALLLLCGDKQEKVTRQVSEEVTSDIEVPQFNTDAEVQRVLRVLAPSYSRFFNAQRKVDLRFGDVADALYDTYSENSLAVAHHKLSTSAAPPFVLRVSVALAEVLEMHFVSPLRQLRIERLTKDSWRRLVSEPRRAEELERNQARVGRAGRKDMARNVSMQSLSASMVSPTSPSSPSQFPTSKPQTPFSGSPSMGGGLGAAAPLSESIIMATSLTVPGSGDNQSPTAASTNPELAVERPLANPTSPSLARAPTGHFDATVTSPSRVGTPSEHPPAPHRLNSARVHEHPGEDQFPAYLETEEPGIVRFLVPRSDVQSSTNVTNSIKELHRLLQKVDTFLHNSYDSEESMWVDHIRERTRSIAYAKMMSDIRELNPERIIEKEREQHMLQLQQAMSAASLLSLAEKAKREKEQEESFAAHFAKSPSFRKSPTSNALLKVQAVALAGLPTLDSAPNTPKVKPAE